ncbi:hypothetical protein H6G33_17800 [Calothrix sp. FACHB-1219]|uniref:hypothetical protein n=1 Tax=unclassified Calothrix TaxID=2619626 RepID=UPI00168A05B8|nr:MULTISPECIES: hypothetical protein [unclassified Calothrix]MBD2202733.1 hypothetical protein [Calothrix sp. FACHB-168]MBD2218886.1 hypothetical protein [Calothrix sp. FACHB-1219]
MIPDAEIEKFTTMLDNYINGSLPMRKLSALKGTITRKLNEWGKKYGVETTRETALNIVRFFRLVHLDNSRLELWINRLTVGSLYDESDRVFGWHDPNSQVQAEVLPLTSSSRGISVNFYGFHWEQQTWESRGFYEAQPMPWTRYEESLEVTFNKFCKPKKWAWYWACWGYALAEPLPYTVHEDCLEVDRNIKDHGWWCAYKWWAGCQRWYKDKHPEWFEND